MSLHRILREKIYTGKIEHKKNGTVAPGEHDAIISQELFDVVQAKLQESSNGKSGRSNGSPNLLSGKIYNASGTKFTNQKANKSKGERNYYSSRGFYLPAGDIDKLATETIQEFLDSDTGTLPLGLKQIDWENTEYMKRRKLIQTIITKAIYTTDKVTFWLDVSHDNLHQFTNENFINQTCNPMKFAVNGDTVIIEKDIVINKGVGSNKYRTGVKGLLTKTENNHLITRAFAIAWKYKEMYERLGEVNTIAAEEKASSMTIYRYLNLAYLCPTQVNEIMSGKSNYTVDELFTMAARQ